MAAALQGDGDMTFITDEERRSLAQAIRQAEEKTSGELVTVLAAASDRYIFVSLFWAASVAIAIHGGLSLTSIAVDRFIVEVAAFLVCALLFQWAPIRFRLAPKRLKHLRAHRVAREQFFEQGVHLTDDHTGVLLFVSVAEHYVELIADKGINDAVAEGAWDEIVSDFVGSVRIGRIAEGFDHAIARIGALLKTHAPAGDENRNELPDHLIEI